MTSILPPDQCHTMTEVRLGVDATDRAIVELLATRFGYMRAAARIKPERTDVRDEPRKAQVIENARCTAAECGVPVELAARLYETLIEGSIAYEFDAFDARTR